MKAPFKIVIVVILISLLVCASFSFASSVPSGYERILWNSGIEKVAHKYPRGQTGKLGQEVFYRQLKPNVTIARRNFAFKNDRLHTVSVAYDRRYVEKKGIERLLAGQKKVFGEGVMDISQAPHMISCRWENRDTTVTFSYAPKRPDMTVIVYEMKGLD